MNSQNNAKLDLNSVQHGCHNQALHREKSVCIGDAESHEPGAASHRHLPHVLETDVPCQFVNI